MAVSTEMKLNHLPETFSADQATIPAQAEPFNSPLPLKGFITVKTRFIKAFARFGRHNLVQPTTPSRSDFLPNFPVTMKSISRNTARMDFHPCEIRGQKRCCRGGPGPAAFVAAVRSNRLPGKFWGRSQSTLPGGFGYVHRRLAFRGQGHRRNHFFRDKDVLPQKRHFSRVLPGLGRYNFVQSLNLAAEIFCHAGAV